MPNLTASIPHQVSRAEAKRRITEQLNQIRQQGGLVGHLQTTWTGDRMDFTASVMGQSFSGHALVDDQMVHVEVILPWLLSMLAGPIKDRIEHEGRQLLAAPRTDA